jgi:HlyD family secretion protein
VEIIIAVKENVLHIPTQAVLDNNKVYVYQPQSQMVQERTVRVGLSNWDNSEIVEGLQEGESVVISTDRAGLQDGARARVAAE